MKKFGIHIVLLLCLVFQVDITVFSQNISNYTFGSQTGSYTPLSGANSLSATGADNGIANGIPLAFDFYYMGERYSQIGVSSNGWIKFGYTALTSSQTINNLSTGSNRPIIAPLWDDHQVFDGGGDILFLTSGTKPARVFTIEFKQMEWDRLANSDVISYQIKLHETTGKIEFVYSQGAGAVNSGSASIGITATGSGSGNFLSVNGTGVSPAVSSVSESNTLNTKPATGQVYSFSPTEPSAAPSGLTFTNVQCNKMTLNWTNNGSNNVSTIIMTSIDGISYSYATSVLLPATSYQFTGLVPATTYYYKLFYISEGFEGSSFIAGNQTTAGFNAADFSKRWTGGTNDKWSNNNNWAPTGPPGIDDDVYVPDVANDPTIPNNITGLCKSLYIDLGAVLSIGINSPNYFDCYGSIVNNGTINYTGNGMLFINGSPTVISGTGSFTNLPMFLYYGSNTYLQNNISCN